MESSSDCSWVLVKSLPGCLFVEAMYTGLLSILQGQV